MKINSKEYWDSRFETGDWEKKNGREQTLQFSRAQIQYLELNPDFEGSILDFGCGLGDAITTYRNAFPNSKLLGMDVSSAAIAKCSERYGSFATFFQGTHLDVPECDVIICSNVLEHLQNDLEIVNHLLTRCFKLFVVVPYNESPLCAEHLRKYDDQYFQDLKPFKTKIFLSQGWSEFGFTDLLWGVYAKNFARLFSGRRLRNRRRQIMFMFQGLRVR
jgi:SAM-dependent methyltransferase